MAKRKNKAPVQTAKNVQPEPSLTRAGFTIAAGVAGASLIAQFVMALIAYPTLGGTIPSGWVGWATVGDRLPSWYVFVAFPAAEVVILILAIFSPRDKQGRRVMDTGKALSLILVALLFAVLQISVFNIHR